jgi:hypothetical protein
VLSLASSCFPPSKIYIAIPDKNVMANRYIHITEMLPAMREVVAICFLALSISVSATKVVWHKGSVVLAGADQVIIGEISFDPAREVIFFRNGESLTTYPAYKLKSFRFYDSEAGVKRSFVSLKDNHGAVRRHHLYEYVVPGTFAVVKKVKSILEKKDNAHATRNDADFYVFYKRNLVSLSKFRTHVYPEMLSSNHDEVLSYVHRNNLDVNLPGNAIMVIKFFNTEVAYSALAANR